MPPHLFFLFSYNRTRPCAANKLSASIHSRKRNPRFPLIPTITSAQAPPHIQYKQAKVKYTTISSVIRRATVSVALIVAALSATSCDSMIYDEEGDCDPHYKVRFKYDRNLKYSDAFAAEVKEVTLYVVDDATGKVVWQKHDSGEHLRSGSYLMDVDVVPGTYTLVAWCGQGHTSSFDVTEAEHYTGLQCSLLERTGHPEGFAPEGSAVRKDLYDLYHGKLAAQKFPNDQGTHIFTVDLDRKSVV